MNLLRGALFPVLLILSTQLLWAQAIERGVDMPGGDYTSFDIGGGPRACLSACASSRHCRAWTWVRAGFQSASPRCWLKDSIPGGTPNDCCASGVIR
jgi:hypothetical protein